MQTDDESASEGEQHEEHQQEELVEIREEIDERQQLRPGVRVEVARAQDAQPRHERRKRLQRVPELRRRRGARRADPADPADAADAEEAEEAEVLVTSYAMTPHTATSSASSSTSTRLKPSASQMRSPRSLTSVAVDSAIDTVQHTISTSSKEREEADPTRKVRSSASRSAETVRKNARPAGTSHAIQYLERPCSMSLRCLCISPATVASGMSTRSGSQSKLYAHRPTRRNALSSAPSSSSLSSSSHSPALASVLLLSSLLAPPAATASPLGVQDERPRWRWGPWWW